MTAPRNPRHVSGMTALDPPTVADHRRIRLARRIARARRREIDADRDAAFVEAFRTEMGAVVRSASPVLISMLAIEGLALDDAVALLRPGAGWPAWPRLSGPKTALPVHTQMLRYYMAEGVSRFPSFPPTQISQYPLSARGFDRTDGGRFELQVVDHSLEVAARIGSASIETRFGELCIDLGFALPATIVTASVGRLVEEVVDHEAWRGRGWRIAATADADYPFGQRLIVATGAVSYRTPWSR